MYSFLNPDIKKRGRRVVWSILVASGVMDLSSNLSGPILCPKPRREKVKYKEREKLPDVVIHGANG